MAVAVMNLGAVCGNTPPMPDVMCESTLVSLIRFSDEIVDRHVGAAGGALVARRYAVQMRNAVEELLGPKNDVHHEYGNVVHDARQMLRVIQLHLRWNGVVATNTVVCEHLFDSCVGAAYEETRDVLALESMPAARPACEVAAVEAGVAEADARVRDGTDGIDANTMMFIPETTAAAVECLVCVANTALIRATVPHKKHEITPEEYADACKLGDGVVRALRRRRVEGQSDISSVPPSPLCSAVRSDRRAWRGLVPIRLRLSSRGRGMGGPIACHLELVSADPDHLVGFRALVANVAKLVSNVCDTMRYGRDRGHVVTVGKSKRGEPVYAMEPLCAGSILPSTAVVYNCMVLERRINTAMMNRVGLHLSVANTNISALSFAPTGDLFGGMCVHVSAGQFTNSCIRAIVTELDLSLALA
jgi:hypothetical protein